MASFITLEGVEGSGKTLQLGYLAREFASRKIPFRLTLEPGGTPFGKELRKVLLRLDNIEREPVSELLLYLADRYQHLREVVEPNLAGGVTVLSDRYHDATMAYQGYARGIGFETVGRLAEILEIRNPDLTVVLDIDVEAGLRRARARNVELDNQEWGRFEAEALEFHERVRQGYRLLAEREPGRVFLVDASGDPGEVRRRISALVEEKGLFRV